MLDLTGKKSGFTIVELLIVIVIVAILFAITTTAYAAISSRSYDASVQQDLSNIAKKLKLYKAEHGVYPVTAQLPSLGLKVSKSAYGSHFDNGTSTYNLLYCRMPVSNPTEFAIVAWSRSGTGFQYSKEGQLGKYTGPKTNTAPMCDAAGLPIDAAVTARDWFFYMGNWQDTYIAG